MSESRQKVEELAGRKDGNARQQNVRCHAEEKKLVLLQQLYPRLRYAVLRCSIGKWKRLQKQSEKQSSGADILFN